MKRLLRSCPLLVLTTLIVSCGDDDGGTGPGSGSGSPVTFPLAVGNRWIYQENSTLRGGTADTSTITGTEIFRGEPYFVMDESDPDDDGVLLRQAGQDFLVVFRDSSFSRGGDPTDEWLDRQFSATLPWKFADFDAAEDTPWTIVSAETTLTVESVESVIKLSVTGRNLGRESVTVPAGTFSDTYHGQVRFQFSLDDVVQQQSFQDLWVKDGVGLVKTADEEFGGGVTDSRTSELVSYDLN